MSIIDSAKEASRQRLRPILMTSFAFVMGVLPMARATGAGAYSRNSLGIVIAFGIAVSTVLGRFVIPVYYVLGERIIDFFARLRPAEDDTDGQPTHPDRSDAVAVLRSDSEGQLDGLPPRNPHHDPGALSTACGPVTTPPRPAYRDTHTSSRSAIPRPGDRGIIKTPGHSESRGFDGGSGRRNSAEKA